jgi:NhaP-type Na+/H+ or K+/H+ antiporter
MSTQAILIGLALVLILSVVARLFGGWAGIPVIVPLLAVGVIAGESVTGIINPNELLGDSLSPFVQIVVALILFEGALGLRFDQFPRAVRPAVLRLITLGVLVTWGLGALGAIVLLGLPAPIAVLVGAILIVSGPTVVLPLLAFVRPPEHVRATLKWEGVIMDPLGAIIGVVVFASLSATNGRSEFSIEQFLLSVTVGVASGLVFALLLMPILRTHKFSGRDKVAATLMMVVAAFLVANLAYDESGLVAALVMGIVLINQSRVNITYIDEFKETLIPILLGILFVLLAANIDIGDVIALGLPGLAFVVFLAFVVRPLAVLTTVGLPLTWKERFLMMTFSARGVVAAATAPVFGLALVDKGMKGADQIVPVVFLVIAGTVLISAILSPAVAKRLGILGKSEPSIFVIGAPQWAIALGRTLSSVGTHVKFWTVEPAQIERIKEAGLDFNTEPINPRDPERVTGLNGVSLVAIATLDDTLNQLFAYELSEALEPDQIYRVPGPKNALKVVEGAGRLITTDVGIDEIETRVAGGEEFSVLDSDSELPDGAVPFLVLETTKTLSRPEVFFFCDRPESPRRRVRRVVALMPSAASASL